MDERISKARDIARTGIKTLELLVSGDLGQDQERNKQMVLAIAGQFEWAAELLRESLDHAGPLNVSQDVGQTQGQDTTQ